MSILRAILGFFATISIIQSDVINPVYLSTSFGMNANKYMYIKNNVSFGYYGSADLYIGKANSLSVTLSSKFIESKMEDINFGFHGAIKLSHDSTKDPITFPDLKASRSQNNIFRRYIACISFGKDWKSIVIQRVNHISSGLYVSGHFYEFKSKEPSVITKDLYVNNISALMMYCGVNYLVILNQTSKFIMVLRGAIGVAGWSKASVNVSLEGELSQNATTIPIDVKRSYNIVVEYGAEIKMSCHIFSKISDNIGFGIENVCNLIKARESLSKNMYDSVPNKFSIDNSVFSRLSLDIGASFIYVRV